MRAAVCLLAVLVIGSQGPPALSSPEPGDRERRSLDLDGIFQQMGQLRNKLPGVQIPTHYRLEIQPHLEEARFTGRVRIRMKWNDTASSITLNAHPDLEISSSDVAVKWLPPWETEANGATVDLRVARAERRSRGSSSVYVVDLEQMVRNGSTTELDLAFQGRVATNETVGLFRGEYTDAEGAKRYFAATYFQPNHASRMFPCFDEPVYKAIFRLSVVRPRNATVVSNAELESSTEVPGQPDAVRDTFAETPAMATYQLTLAISELERVESAGVVQGPTRIGVWARRSFARTAKGVLGRVVDVVDYFRRYFDSSVGVPKLDVVALPSYASVKRSNGWGLVIFKESDLETSCYWQLAHELVYQWIGQLVTPCRWTDVQYTKALNAFLASMAALDLNPEEVDGKWPMTMLYSLYYEYAGTYPFSRVAGMKNNVDSAKTELVFRMLNLTLREHGFREGTRGFVRSYSNSSGSASDLPKCYYMESILDELYKCRHCYGPFQDVDVHDIFRTWTTRDRLPLVTVTRDYETGSVKLNQTVYLRNAPPPTMDKISGYRWDIPIVVVTQDQLGFDTFGPTRWMTDRDMSLRHVAESHYFLIVNPEEIGMFPVNYDPKNWEMLIEYLRGPNRTTIPEITRAKLLHDSWNLAYAGQLSFKIALDMTLFLRQERNHVVWQAAFTMFDHVGRRIERPDVYAKFETYAGSLVKPLYDELGAEARPNDPSWKIHLRGLAKFLLCLVGYEPCVREAREQYKKWMTDAEPDKGNPVANEFICPVFKWGTDEEWEFGLQRVINFPSGSPERKQSERTYLLKTLAGCPRDSQRIKRILNVAILERRSNFTDSDVLLIFSMLTGSPVGYITLFNYLTDHWNIVKQKFENKTHLWDGIVSSATSWFNTEEGYRMVSELYASREHEFGSATSIVQEALKNIQQQMHWGKKNLPVIDSWLTENLKDLNVTTVAAAAAAAASSPDSGTAITAATPSTTVVAVTPLAG
ncbi:aminopeptidase N [Orussus abietinus]|uniref:aminopeptidase N n=1 Tax=Orussus abietinus TaxID=222816 RepID=UPI000625A151|nr:aminopeptidase N [Orussus abietinus]